jgi:pre-mRNA-processing factor 6
MVTAVKLEIASRNHKAAVIALNKGLQACPSNGELWSLAIQLEPKTTRKKKSADAVTVCPNDPYVYLSTAKIFWRENKQSKMLRWIE